mgnify:CR=1 FL=1
MTQPQLEELFWKAQKGTHARRVVVAEALLRQSQFGDKTIARSKQEIPVIRSEWMPTIAEVRGVNGGKFALARTKDMVGNVGPIADISPVVRNTEGRYYSGQGGSVREVEPEFDE